MGKELRHVAVLIPSLWNSQLVTVLLLERLLVGRIAKQIFAVEQDLGIGSGGHAKQMTVECAAITQHRHQIIQFALR